MTCLVSRLHYCFGEIRVWIVVSITYSEYGLFIFKSSWNMVWVGLGRPRQIPTKLLSLCFLSRMSLESRDGTAQGKDWEITQQLPSWAKRSTWGKFIWFIANWKYSRVGSQWAADSFRASLAALPWGLSGVARLVSASMWGFSGAAGPAAWSTSSLFTVRGVCRVVPLLWFSHSTVQHFHIS